MCAVGRDFDLDDGGACPHEAVAWVLITPGPQDFDRDQTRHHLCRRHFDIIARLFPKAQVWPDLN